MRQIDLLIFDLDGTLVDTRRDIANSVNFARNQLGLPSLELTKVMQYVGDGLQKLLERSIPEEQWDKIDEAILLFRNHYRDHLLDFSSFYPGIDDVLHHFLDKKMAVVSNKPVAFTRSILEGLGIENGFDCVIGGDSLPSMKPNPEPILTVLNRLSVNPEAAVMIGDSPSDIKAGHSAGTLTCAVTYGYRSKELLEESRPDFLIDDSRELKYIFE